MTIDSSFRKSVIVSIIASLTIMLVVKPLLNTLWNTVLWLGTSWYNDFIDSVYRNAALGQRDWVAVQMLMLGLSIIIGMLLGTSIAFFSGGRLTKAMSTTGIRGTKIAKYVFAAYAIIMICGAVRIVVPTYVDLQLNTSFRQRLAVIAPVVENKQMLELHSAWALMTSRSDYEAITARMDSLARANGVSLPKPLLD